MIHLIARFIAALLAEVEAERANITTGPPAGSPVCQAELAGQRETPFAPVECRQG